MSLESWLSEFYPKEADKTTKEEAIQHSLKKWQGLYKVSCIECIE